MSCGARSAQVRPHEPAAHTRLVCRQVRSAGELADHHEIRHRVFVDEQSVFTGSDLDQHDQDDAVIRLIGYCDGIPVGSVRLFVLDEPAGLWQGDRLAVLAPYRIRGLGAPLVRCAVATAGARGGRTMIAHIQLANITFFHRLGWNATGEVEIYAGLPHQPMTIALPTPDAGMAVVRRLAAGISAPAP
jgi:putative N-acetyltransferase (TIGR04045 family)